jgi:hypothetical protein
MTSENGRAERLAQWVRSMPLADQVLITGTTLVFEELKSRRSDLPFAIDEEAIREAATPSEAVRVARELMAAYRTAPPHIGPDGVDEHWRVANMAAVVADTIEAHFG